MIEGFLGGAVLPSRSILIVCEDLARRLQRQNHQSDDFFTVCG